MVLTKCAHRVTRGNIHLILAALAWPTVALVAVIVFRESVRNLIARLTQAKLPGDTSLQFDPTALTSNAGEDRKAHNIELENSQQKAAEAPKLDKEKVGHIYWLGADLHSLIWQLATNGTREHIIFYLRQVNHHMKSCGLANSSQQQLTQRLYDEGQKKISSEWTPALRQQYAQDVKTLITTVGTIAEETQGGSFVGVVKDKA